MDPNQSMNLDCERRDDENFVKEAAKKFLYRNLRLAEDNNGKLKMPIVVHFLSFHF